MEWVALALFVVFAVVGFGIRTAVHLRRTGDSGFRGLSGSPGSPEWWAGRLFGVAVLTAFLAPVAGLVGLAPLPLLDHAGVQAAGALLALLGIAGTFVTQMDLGESWRIGVDDAERTDLVTAGAFAQVRNPIFTAMLTTAGGIALLVPNVIAVVGWALLLVAIQLQVRVVEEPYLRRQHGVHYERYQRTAGRFLPRVGLLR